MIAARKVTKAFGHRVALDRVDLQVNAGERVMLVGPNGAGKTTLLRIIATLSRPTSGTLEIAGVDALRSGVQARNAIGFLSHETLLYDDLTARQNLRFYARMYGLAHETERIEALLVAVALQSRGDDLVRTFSRGMLQRLAVARAILHRPGLLLLDEPYSGLDPLAADALTSLLTDLVAEGCTLLLTTHHPAAEGALTERVVVLSGGRIIQDGPVGDASTFPLRYRALLAQATA